MGMLMMTEYKRIDVPGCTESYLVKKSGIDCAGVEEVFIDPVDDPLDVIRHIMAGGKWDDLQWQIAEGREDRWFSAVMGAATVAVTLDTRVYTQLIRLAEEISRITLSRLEAATAPKGQESPKA